MKVCNLFSMIVIALLASQTIHGARGANIEAGPIGNNDAAKLICPSTCSPYGSWPGTWATTVPGQMSVCGCRFNGPWTADIEAGPLFNQGDADQKCPSTCSPYGSWNGQWTTTVRDEMSVCGCRFSVTKLGWSKDGLDTSRGFKECKGKEVNYWQWDDQCRDHLDMDPADLTYTKEITRGTTSLHSNRYIYVLRGTDGKLVIRPYDRDTETRYCSAWYSQFRYAKNMRSSGYLHVRHSQLNGGWDPLYAAGEIKVWNDEVTVINNESGHFKPPANFPERVFHTLKAWGVAVSNDVKVGSFEDYSAALSSNECWALRHDEL